LKIFYTDHYVLPLPEGHRFPMAKYSLLRRRVEEARLAGGYSTDIADTVDIYFSTVEIAASFPRVARRPAFFSAAPQI
jgi:hypothetical protein